MRHLHKFALMQPNPDILASEIENERREINSNIHRADRNKQNQWSISRQPIIHDPSPDPRNQALQT